MRVCVRKRPIFPHEKQQVLALLYPITDTIRQAGSDPGAAIAG
jgi:hypothetical protein